MKRYLPPLLAVCLAGSLVACGPREFAGQLRTPWTHLEFNNERHDFQFVVVSDRTGGHRPGVFRDAMRRINLLQPEFVMSVGDLIEGYTDDSQKLDQQWNEFNGMVQSLDMPFFYTPGNHDISNAHMGADWRKRFGKPYYHFRYQKVLFVVLNTDDPSSDELGHTRGNIGDHQREWLAGVLTRHKSARWTFLFMHKPLWLYGEKSNWNDIAALLNGRERVTVFAGHHHRYLRTSRNQHDLYRLATTGGATDDTGPVDGSFDHVAWVTVSGAKPIIANLMLDGIWTDDPIAEARAADETLRLADGGVYGRVIGIGKSYANIQTNISRIPLDTLRIGRRTHFRMTYGDKEFKVLLGDDYSDVPKGDWVALINEVGNLEIAISFGHAAKELQCQVGDVIFIKGAGP